MEEKKWWGREKREEEEITFTGEGSVHEWRKLLVLSLYLGSCYEWGQKWNEGKMSMWNDLQVKGSILRSTEIYF